MLELFASTLASTSVTIDDTFVSDVRLSPTNASAQYQLTNAGIVNRITSAGGTVQTDTWISPISFAGANYEVKATSLGPDTLTSGTTGSWLALSSTQTWSLSQTTDGTSTVALTIEIRNAVSLAVLDTATITLSAERTP